MSERAEKLAQKVEQANDALRRAVEQTTAEQWNAICADGEWTQGYAGFHAANSIGFISGLVQGIANGESRDPITMDDINAQNAADNKANSASCSKEQALEAIKMNSPAALSMVRGLSDEQLNRTSVLLVGMPEISVEQVIDMLLIGHPAAHTESIVKAR